MKVKIILSAAVIILLAAALIIPFAVCAESENDDVSLIPGKGNAYILFGTETVCENMMYRDGVAENITDENDPDYSELFKMDGITGRKVYKPNIVGMKVSPSYYKPEDSEFLVLITYYDFGPQVGYFYLQYKTQDGKTMSASVKKEGVTPKWCTQRLMLTNAALGGKLEGGADFRLLTNAYNAFAKVEVINISRARQSGENVAGTVNSIQAEALGIMGLMEGKNGEPANTGLDEEMTRGETVKAFVKAIGKEKEALGNKRPCTFSDVGDELSHYVGYAEQLGVVKGVGNDLFNPDAPATPRQLLMLYFRLLGIESDNLYENALTIAESNKLVLKFDMILNADSPLTRDGFAAIAYNSLRRYSSMTYSTVLTELVKNGTVSVEQIEKTGIGELAAYRYAVATKLPSRKMTDAATGRTYRYLNIGGDKAIRSYVNEQEWNSAGDKFIIGNDKTQAMYEYDTKTEKIRFLDYAEVSDSLTANVNYNDLIYYKNTQGEYWVMDWKTYRRKKLAELPEGVSNGVGISVMRDSTFDKPGYIGVIWMQSSDERDYFAGGYRYRVLARLNCETGEWYTERSHEFTTPFAPSTGHPIINPVDKDIMFFCHEGTANLVHDRLWIMNLATGEDYNVFVQTPVNDEITGEPSGHELWTLNGKSIVFIKYPMATNIGKSGPCRVSLDGSKREYFTDDNYNYWHCTITADEEWIAADTQSSPREIVMVNTNTYKTVLLASFKVGPNKNHPYQPHPTLSWNGKYIAWQMCDENDMLGTAWMDVTDLTGKKSEGGIFGIDGTLSYASWENSQFSVEKVNYKGRDCLKSAAGGGIYVDINDDVKYCADGSAEISFFYLDAGHQPIEIKYTSPHLTVYDLAKQEDKTVSIERTNSGKWKKATVKIDDMCMLDSGKHLTDFAITSKYSDVYISDLSIKFE